MSKLEQLRKYYLTMKDLRIDELKTVYTLSGLLTSLTRAAISAVENEYAKQGKKVEEAEEDVVKGLRDLIFSGDMSGLKYVLTSKFGYTANYFTVADFEPWYDEVLSSELIKSYVIRGPEAFTYKDKEGLEKQAKRVYISLDVFDGLRKEIIRKFDVRKVFRDVYHDWASHFPRVYGKRK